MTKEEKIKELNRELRRLNSQRNELEQEMEYYEGCLYGCENKIEDIRDKIKKLKKK